VQVVFATELVRGLLIILAVLPLILTWRAQRRWLAVWCGLILFVVGGLVPLLPVTILPVYLRVTSGIEIFFQNFSTGVVAAFLLGQTLKTK
jgi:hypothetical protein